LKAVEHLANGLAADAPRGRRPVRARLDDVLRRALSVTYQVIFLFQAERRGLLGRDASATVRAVFQGPRPARAGSYELWSALQGALKVLSPAENALIGFAGPRRRRRLRISDRDLSPVLDAVACGADALCPGRFGDLYEAAVECRLSPRSGGLRLTRDKTRAKARGGYYTPRETVKYIVENTLGPVLDDRLKRGGSRREVLKAVANIGILDPAMGDGRFLVEAIDFVRGAASSMGARAPTARMIAENCIYGLDIDPAAAELAAAAVWLHCGDAGLRPATLLERLRCGDALATTLPEGFPYEFDAVIGNPPYVGFKTWAADAALSRRLRRFRCFDWHADLFYFFFERGLEMLRRPHGRLGFITSRYFLRSPSAAKLRELLEPHLVAVKDFGSDPVFSRLGIQCAVSICSASGGLPRHARVSRQAERSQQSLLEAATRVFRVGTIPLKAVAHVRAGMQTGRDEVFVKRVMKRGRRCFGIMPDGGEAELPPDLVYPFVKNGEIQRYAALPTRWCLFTGEMTKEDLAARYPNCARFLSAYKDELLARRSSFRMVGADNWFQWMHHSRLHFSAGKIIHPYRARENRFAPAPARLLGSIDVGFIIPHGIDRHLLLALLNSSLLQDVYHGYAKELAKGVFDYYPKHLGLLPLPDLQELGRKRPARGSAAGSGELMKRARRVAASREPSSAALCELLRSLAVCAVKERAASKNMDETHMRRVERMVNLLVCRLYGLTAAEAAELAAP